QQGDSGSPLFGWDSSQNRWELVGIAEGLGGNIETGSVIFSLIDKSLTNSFQSKYKKEISEDSTLSPNNKEYEDKDIVFTNNNGVLTISGNNNLKTSSLRFTHDYIIKSDNNGTWKGAGVIVDKGAYVTWRVNGFKDDDLHKISEGTLIVNGTGINQGGLNVGDGTVILNQQKSNDGNVQAFSGIKIVSGRPTLILNDSNQVNPDNISWGYRGGTLDVNGNDMTFHQLNAADYGAIITNNNEKTADANLNFNKHLQRGNYIYHSQIKGNINITNTTLSPFSTVFDGEINISGTFSQRGGKLEFQGHPVIHASSDRYIASFL
ncbi:autotransporter outer membrane beta-barrel domain-containing protein, partial [Escherichia coli]|nr:autotransporter outer membrane beta-barrel domain-containing protein [Escherichia coli]